jgi:glutaredoxin 3
VFVDRSSLRARFGGSSNGERIVKIAAFGGEDLALVIYTKPGCPYCQQARDHYNSKGISFIDYDAQTDRNRRADMLAYSGGDPSVHCIVEYGKYKGSGWGDPPRG